MYLNEILQLDKTTQSIKKIDLFLAGCNKKSLDYYKAFAYKNIIFHFLGKTNDALKALYSFVNDFPKLGDQEVITICDAIIDITLDVKLFDQTRKYIDEKKKHLKVSNLLLNTKDEIRLAIAKHDYNRAIGELKNFSNEILTAEESCWAYECLADIYYEVHDFTSYLEIIPKLEKIYQETLNTNKLIEVEYKKLDMAYSEGNYIKVICEGNRILNEYNLEPETKVLVATLLLKAYIESKDYRQAGKVESENEEYLQDVSTPTALAFCKASLELYTQTNSISPKMRYENLVHEYSQTKKKALTKLESARTGIIVPKVKEALIDDDYQAIPKVIPNLHELTKNVHEVYVSKNYTKLEKLFSVINNLDTSIKFREIFRLALIELSKFIPFEEAYLLYYDRGYNGLHYKKERAYDKHIDYDKASDTINMLAISQEQEIYLDRHSTAGLKNIVTQEQFIDIPYGIAIPLLKEDTSFASIAFWAYEPFLDQDLVYETLKLISQMLFRVLSNELMQNEIRASNKKMFFIYEHMTSGIKELMEGHIHLSSQAKSILGGFEDITEQDFKSHIHASDLGRYEAMIEDIYKYLSKDQSIEYRYKKNQEYIEIKETFFPSYENGILSLYSLIEDNQKNKEKSQELYEIAFINPISKLETELKLGLDLKEVMKNRKLSLAIFDVHDFKLYEELYGINTAKQLILAIAEQMQSYFLTTFQVKIYHLGYDRYAILCLDMNDKRSIDHLLFKAFEKVSKAVNLLSSRIKLLFNCGVYRLSKNANIDDPNKIIDYAYDALSNTKNLKDLNHHISHYDGELSKIRFTENQLITHISEAIDHGRLGVSYKQLVNLSKKEVYAYIAQISLDSFEVDLAHMKKVIQRRMLEELLDKYVINCCSKELKILGEVSKTNLPILVPLSQKTVETNLSGFVETQQNFYKTTKRLIFYYQSGAVLELKKLKSLGYKVASSNLLDVYQQTIDYYIYDLLQNGFDSVIELKALCKEKGITFILSNVSTKEEVLKATTLGIEYLYGSYWKKSIRMNKVLEKFA
ncbi:MAG: diguanylate cyclase [Roseburia sp.]|nr:diguanylate cyclase [Anaeroplasma bactoclasticum]MCM1195860.1 diguanylate cyclase [Roseburia sp.]MCM1556552.1 diguanylate cyclase [Anaeroplasma bactoclasticum]